MTDERPEQVVIGVCPEHGPHVVAGTNEDYSRGPGNLSQHPYFGCPEIVDYDNVTCGYRDPQACSYVRVTSDSRTPPRFSAKNQED